MTHTLGDATPIPSIYISSVTENSCMAIYYYTHLHYEFGRVRDTLPHEIHIVALVTCAFPYNYVDN